MYLTVRCYVEGSYRIQNDGRRVSCVLRVTWQKSVVIFMNDILRSGRLLEYWGVLSFIHSYVTASHRKSSPKSRIMELCTNPNSVDPPLWLGAKIDKHCYLITGRDSAETKERQWASRWAELSQHFFLLQWRVNRDGFCNCRWGEPRKGTIKYLFRVFAEGACYLYVLCPRLTNNRVASFLLRSYSHSACQEIPHLLWNTKAYYRVLKKQSRVPVLSQMNPRHGLTSSFSNVSFNSYHRILVMVYNFQIYWVFGLYPSSKY
jgi:hypothetical protein